MKLASQTEFTHQIRDRTIRERADFSCKAAKQLEKAGEYEKACEALAEFWPERDKPPHVTELDEARKAELFMRVGALMAWLGSSRQSSISQERAKDLITNGIELFERLEQSVKVAEARSELAVCYFREGAFDEARMHLASAMSLLKNENADQRACVLIRMGTVEAASGRLNEAHRIYQQAATLLESSADQALKGALHNQLAMLYNNLAAKNCSDDYTDRALIEFAAASYHFEQAGHARYCGCTENNLAFLYLTIGRLEDAHEHLDRARTVLFNAKNSVDAARVDETRARVFLAEGRLKEAQRLIRSSVKTLEKSGEQAVLAEALTTQGVVQARLRNHAQARALLQRAAEVAQTAGDLEGAGRAQLSMIEELSAQTTTPELASIYESAAELLHRSQDPSSSQRLIACARKLISQMVGEEHAKGLAIERDSWEGFSLKREIMKIEKTVIERALRDAGGSVSKASRLLGFKHHQSLIALIQGRHSDLQEQRSIVRRRRHHLFSKGRGIKKKPVPSLTAEAVAILHVEDNKPVARLVRDTLAVAGMHVDSCVNGLTALEILKSSARYDALIVDNNLPGLSGLELVLRARSLSHRANLPIIMLSGDDCEKEAWRAGVDAFLLKPKGIDQLASTITRSRKESRKNGK